MSIKKEVPYVLDHRRCYCDRRGYSSRALDNLRVDCGYVGVRNDSSRDRVICSTAVVVHPFVVEVAGAVGLG